MEASLIVALSRSLGLEPVSPLASSRLRLRLRLASGPGLW